MPDQTAPLAADNPEELLNAAGAPFRSSAKATAARTTGAMGKDPVSDPVSRTRLRATDRPPRRRAASCAPQLSAAKRSRCAL